MAPSPAVVFILLLNLATLRGMDIVYVFRGDNCVSCFCHFSETSLYGKDLLPYPLQKGFGVRKK